MIRASPLCDFHVKWGSSVGRPSTSRQLIPTNISFVKWDLKDVENFKSGALHRMAVDTQRLSQLECSDNGLINNAFMQDCLKKAADNLALFLQSRIERLKSSPIPLTRAGAIDVINKLRRVQPRAKINKLLKIVDEIPWDSVNNFKVVPKSNTQVFIKNEGYPSGSKPPRLIAFPQEGEKLIMSMAFYHIMYPLFSSGYCTKEIPEHLRPRVIEKRLGDLPKRFVADYTSFECVPNKLMMQLGEHRVLRQLVSSEYQFVFDYIERGGTLRAKNGFTIHTSAVQYSGRYTTSLSNTIRNKLLMDAVALYMGLRLDQYRGVFEGDDSITAWPDCVEQSHIESALGKLGVTAEIHQVESFGEAGYCSTYWNDENEIICDPVKVLATFPFSSSQLSNSPKNALPLLSAKAMSLAFRAPGCPIIWSICQRYIQKEGLLETRNEYERRWYAQFTNRANLRRASGRRRRAESSMRVTFNRWDLIKEPTSRQRMLFEKVFGIDEVNQRAAEYHILHDDGFHETLFACVSASQVKTGVDIEELKQIYNHMRQH